MSKQNPSKEPSNRENGRVMILMVVYRIVEKESRGRKPN